MTRRISASVVLLLALLATLLDLAIAENPFAIGTAADVPESSWEILHARPNASAIVSLTAPNVSAPYPGNPIDGWEVAVQVAADLPAISSSSGARGPKFVAGTAVSLRAPVSISTCDNNERNLVPQDPSWHVFHYLLRGDRLADAASPNWTSSCAKLLPEKCLSDLKTVGGPMVRMLDTQVFLPPSCASTFGSFSMYEWGKLIQKIPLRLALVSFHGSSPQLTPVLPADSWNDPSSFNGSDIFRLSSDERTKADTGPFMDAVRQPMVFMSLWSSARGLPNDTSAISLPVTLACLRPGLLGARPQPSTVLVNGVDKDRLVRRDWVILSCLAAFISVDIMGAWL